MLSNVPLSINLTQFQELRAENTNDFRIVDRLDLKQDNLVNGECEILGYYCCGIFANAIEEIDHKLRANSN